MTLSDVKVNPRFDWLLHQEKIHKSTTEHPWLWDNDLVALFLYGDIYNDGIRSADHMYTYWLSMMMKQADEPYLSFIKEYLETHERKYDYNLNGVTPRQAMRMFGDPYIVSVFRLYQENHPEIYGVTKEKEKWGYVTR